jgi:hypothetical protein
MNPQIPGEGQCCSLGRGLPTTARPGYHIAVASWGLPNHLTGPDSGRQTARQQVPEANPVNSGSYQECPCSSAHLTQGPAKALTADQRSITKLSSWEQLA